MEIVFDHSLNEFILESFDISTNPDGVLVEKNDPGQKVLTRDGQEIELNKFGGILKGSEIFLRNDVISLIQFCDDMRG